MLFALRERGQGLTEYAFIIMLVALAVIAVLSLLGPAIRNFYEDFIPRI